MNNRTEGNQLSTENNNRASEQQRCFVLSESNTVFNGVIEQLRFLPHYSLLFSPVTESYFSLSAHLNNEIVFVTQTVKYILIKHWKLSMLAN